MTNKCVQVIEKCNEKVRNAIDCSNCFEVIGVVVFVLKVKYGFKDW